MTKQFKNDFLEKSLGLVYKTQGWTGEQSMCSTYGYFAASSGGKASGHGGCYAGWQYSAREEEWTVFPACTKTGMSPRGQLDKLPQRIEYVHNVFFNPESLWFPIVEQFKDMFDGYETDDQKAELVARYGFVVGPQAGANLTMEKIGALMVFHRVQYEFTGTRETFFTLNKDLPDYPLNWRIAAASHIRSGEAGAACIPCGEYGGHHVFNHHMYPSTFVCVIKNKIKADIGKGMTKGYGPHTWMDGNADRLFIDAKIKGCPSYEPFEPRMYAGLDQWGDPKYSKAFSPTEIALNSWKVNVEPYV